ncbi:YqgQ family protein [Alkalihalobacillus sp. AL-G]|uniref:YqgQ family protein n=1 Tax=Alkalihalobacillus sp. AL-G TaxID=2926399 RepID=UPI00272A8F8F|nr:YqgQ family protein [Alkalihalobacillus sp. AL-G]WLD92063.1 YqgQ family protein [Alkalihalobacillus sp. AL-G]
MKTFYDVQQLLKRYGTFIYTGNRQADLELMQEEIQELYRNGLLDQSHYTSALLLLRQELQKHSKNH